MPKTSHPSSSRLVHGALTQCDQIGRFIAIWVNFSPNFEKGQNLSLKSEVSLANILPFFIDLGRLDYSI